MRLPADVVDGSSGDCLRSRDTLLRRRPDPRLSPFVSHYWLGHNATQTLHSIMPDGCVDLVFEWNASSTSAWLYGTTTRRTDVPIRLRHQYLGIRFKPGQVRRFFGGVARQLTNTRVALEDLGPGVFGAQRSFEELRDHASFGWIDALLTGWLVRHPPEVTRIDAALSIIETSPHPVRVDRVARTAGIGRRQLERLFLEHVGISPKMFLKIQRVAHALTTLSDRSFGGLSEIALEVGYADQSHMIREFSQVLGVAPGKLRSADVAFVQDLTGSGS